MRVLQVINERTGRELGEVIIHDIDNIYNETAYRSASAHV